MAQKILSNKADAKFGVKIPDYWPTLPSGNDDLKELKGKDVELRLFVWIGNKPGFLKVYFVP